MGMGVYMSVILRPKLSVEHSLLITSCAAVAVAELQTALLHVDGSFGKYTAKLFPACVDVVHPFDLTLDTGDLFYRFSHSYSCAGRDGLHRHRRDRQTACAS